MRVKDLREERQLSRAQLAKIVGSCERNVGRWENGESEPSCNFLIKLADYFNVTIDYIVGREDDFGNAVNANEKDDKPPTRERQVLALYSKLDESQQQDVLTMLKALAEKK